MAPTPDANAGTETRQFRIRTDPRADYWVRQYGVPWDQISRAVKAVNARASKVKLPVPPPAASEHAAVSGQH